MENRRRKWLTVSFIAVSIGLCGGAALGSKLMAQSYEGYADALTTGGEGGTEIWVTNLNDSGPGSLRDAIASLTGAPTIIKFAVGGKICVGSEIRISKPFVTVAGETAPPPGITLECAYSTDRCLGINTTDVIVRHIRLRNSPLENIQIWGDARIIIDHVSSTWAGDGAIDWNSGRVTISRSLIAGSVEGGKTHGNRVSVHHNLYTDNNRRQPRVFEPAGPDYDIRNNYIRNWWNKGTQIVGTGASCNIINNFYGPPAPGESWSAAIVNENAGPFYTAGNVASDPAAIDLNAIGTAQAPFDQPAVTTLPAQDVPANVLADVGAQPTDAVDQGWIDGTTTGYRPVGWVPPAGLCGGGGGGGGGGSTPAWSETADYYVDAATGSDSNSGSASQPFKTIAKALSVASAGKKVLVWTGTYQENLTISRGGIAGAPIVVKSDPAAGVVRILGSSTAPVISTTRAGYITLDGFDITGGKTGIDIQCDNCDGWIIKNCVIHGNLGDGVKIRYADDTLIYNSLIYNNGSSYKGVYAFSTASNTRIVQSTIYNHKYNVYFDTSASGEVRNSIINKGFTGVYGRYATYLNVLYSDVYGHTNNYQYVTPGVGTISADPLFVSPADGDFHLQPSSPCKGAADDGGDMGYRYLRVP